MYSYMKHFLLSGVLSENQYNKLINEEGFIRSRSSSLIDLNNSNLNNSSNSIFYVNFIIFNKVLQ